MYIKYIHTYIHTKILTLHTYIHIKMHTKTRTAHVCMYVHIFFVFIGPKNGTYQGI